MEKLREYKEKLDKIEVSCRICHAKMCNICPNNKLKIFLRKEIKSIEGKSDKKNFWGKLKEIIK